MVPPACPHPRHLRRPRPHLRAPELCGGTAGGREGRGGGGEQRQGAPPALHTHVPCTVLCTCAHCTEHSVPCALHTQSCRIAPTQICAHRHTLLAHLRGPLHTPTLAHIRTQPKCCTLNLRTCTAAIHCTLILTPAGLDAHTSMLSSTNCLHTYTFTHTPACSHTCRDTHVAHSHCAHAHQPHFARSSLLL